MERKILVVDDELGIRELLYQAFTKVGYEVVTVPGGKEAIEGLGTHKPDLILLDFNMPGMNGIEVLKEIRSFDNKVKIIMLTGLDNEDLEREARLSGAGGFLQKSLGIDVIVKAINRVLRPEEGYEKEKILVVDDEPAIRSLLESFLTKKGFTVVTASRGEEALEKLREERPILVLLDIKLPGMDGIMTLKRIREIDEKVGVIMITALEEQELFEEAKKYGSYEYVVKPFDLDYLENSVLLRVALVSGVMD